MVRNHAWVRSLCDRNGPLAVVLVQGKVWLLVQYLLIAVAVVPAVVIAVVVVAVLQNVVVFQPQAEVGRQMNLEHSLVPRLSPRAHI